MVHTYLIVITFLITDHDLDRLLCIDRFAYRRSSGVAHTLLITIACRYPHQPDLNNIPDRDHDLDCHFNRGFILDLLIAKVFAAMPII